MSDYNNLPSIGDRFPEMEVKTTFGMKNIIMVNGSFYSAILLISHRFAQLNLLHSKNAMKISKH